VDIGSGPDSRFQRIDNGKVQYYDFDLPVVMEVRRQFFEETDRYHQISSSVFDHEWLSRVSRHPGAVLFLAEGMFMYCNPVEVRALVLRLQELFPGSELVCEVVSAAWLKGSLKRLLDYKLRKQLHFEGDMGYRFGLKHTQEMDE
jgi:O-methyltransferase involved in polyketide biosynthesis